MMKLLLEKNKMLMEHNQLPPPRRNRCFLLFFFCLFYSFVCITFCKISEKVGRDLIKYSGNVGNATRNRLFNFDGDLEHLLDPVTFSMIFYHCQIEPFSVLQAQYLSEKGELSALVK